MQSDLYSLGVLLFYLVTGKFPVNAGSMEQLARAHAHRERQPLRDLRPDLPEPFVAAVERALDSDPTRRYQSVGEFESALRDSLDAPSEPCCRVRRPRPCATPRAFGFAFSPLPHLSSRSIAGLIVWTGGSPASGGGHREPRRAAARRQVRVPGHRSCRDALTEQLIATIGQVDSLRPTSLSSSLPFKGSDLPRTRSPGSSVSTPCSMVSSPCRMCRLQGPETVRLDATLIAAGSGAKLWSGFAVRRRGEMAALLSELARSMTRAVRAQVTRDEALRLRQVRVTNPAAEEAYLQGRLHLAGYGKEAANRALQSFQRAIDADPGYTAAHASAALHTSSWPVSPESRMPRRGSWPGQRSGRHSRPATTLPRPTPPKRILRFLYDWDWDGAERELHEAST